MAPRSGTIQGVVNPSAFARACPASAATSMDSRAVMIAQQHGGTLLGGQPP